MAIDPRIRLRLVEIHKEQQRRRTRLIAIAGAAVVLVLAAWGLSRSPLLSVGHVQVTGAAHVSRAEVLAAAGVAHSRQMIDLDPGTMALGVDSLPWVRDTRVSRRWPRTVVISVSERRPVALMAALGGAVAQVDATGRVLALTLAPVPGLPAVAPAPPSIPTSPATGAGAGAGGSGAGSAGSGAAPVSGISTSGAGAGSAGAGVGGTGSASGAGGAGSSGAGASGVGGSGVGGSGVGGSSGGAGSTGTTTVPAASTAGSTKAAGSPSAGTTGPAVGGAGGTASPPPAPVLAGPPGTTVDARLDPGLTVAAELAGPGAALLNGKVGRITVGTDGQVSMDLAGGGRALLGTTDELGDKLTSLATVLAHIGLQKRTVDVQVPVAPVLIGGGNGQ
jgi:hypothetical protein